AVHIRRFDRATGPRGTCIRRHPRQRDKSWRQCDPIRQLRSGLSTRESAPPTPPATPPATPSSRPSLSLGPRRTVKQRLHVPLHARELRAFDRAFSKQRREVGLFVAQEVTDWRRA